MDLSMPMQPSSMMAPITQQINHMSLGNTGTYMSAAAAPIQGTYIHQYTAVPASALSVDAVVTEDSPRTVPPSSQVPNGQPPLDNDSPAYSYQQTK
ncbi:RNA-binding motif, single-stranded-interacting protein 3-like isoform X2 [Salvelinus namaycush]|uniref:RNA-binding motif, single-stranded-interacting protein 3-like isoform X2 n=1 Tax=Salvelinus namaycush TaxID=8040 RepID=A0A8U0U5S0_SALNM|nr:RNA-binding motif, single-stranded-interacting protein 3-like isoform X2 [Salvelinus namaycush]